MEYIRFVAHKVGFILYKIGDMLMDWAEQNEYRNRI